MGDHVKVLSGNYEGDTGLIVRVEENMVVFISDLTMHELKVLSKDLQLCTDMATGVDSLGQFQWGDLVQLEYVQFVILFVCWILENFLNHHLDNIWSGNVIFCFSLALKQLAQL